MGIVSGIAVYFCIWWVVIFCTLPIGVQPHEEEGIGTAGSAPNNPNLWFKVKLTTIVSAVIWIVIYTLIQMELINFYDIAENMQVQDHLIEKTSAE